MGGGHTVRVDVVSVGQAVGSLDDLLLQGMGVAWDGKGHAAVGVGASLCFEGLTPTSASKQRGRPGAAPPNGGKLLREAGFEPYGGTRCG